MLASETAPCRIRWQCRQHVQLPMSCGSWPRERERERESRREGQATVASAAQCPELKWRRRYKKGVKKFYFLCSYYDLMDVYDTKKQQEKNQIAFYALFTLLLSPSPSLLFSSPTHTLALFQLFDKRCVQIKAASKMGSSSLDPTPIPSWSLEYSAAWFV